MEGTSPVSGRPAGRLLPGRQTDLRVLLDALDATRSGHGGAVVVTGEAGIGKTAVLERFGELVEDAGCRVTWGRGWNALDRQAYGPWVQALGGLVGVDLRDAAASEPGGVATQGPGDAESARARRHDAVVEALRDEGARRPLVLAMDDVQWFDPESVLLMAHVVPRLIGTRVLLVGTVRDTDVTDGHPLRPVLDLMGGTGAVLPLHGLGDTAVAAAVEALTGQPPGPTVSRAVRELTGGNPLFVRELVRLLMSEERLEELGHGGGPTPLLPLSVRDVLDRRLAALPSSTLPVLRALAVLGPEPVVPHLAEVAAVSEADVRRALADASAARLLTDGALPRFSHDLVRETVRLSTPPDELRELHRAAARSAPTWRSGGEGGCHAEVAMHLTAAGDVVGAAPHWLGAARAAMTRSAWHEAVGHVERARDGMPEPPAELLLLLGEALGGRGDPQGAREAYLAAARSARATADVEAFAAAALGYGSGLSGFEVDLFDTHQQELLQEALERLPAGDSSLRSWVLGRLSVAVSFSEAAPRRREMAESAVAMARRVHDPAALARALASWCDSVSGPDHSEARLAASAEMEAAARSAGDPVHVLLALRFRIVALMETGRMGEARQEAAVFEREAALLRHPAVTWYVPLFQGTFAMVRGRVDEALARAGEVLAAAEATGSTNALALGVSQQFGCLLLSGRRQELADLAAAHLPKDLPPGYEPTPSFRPTLAIISLVSGRADAAAVDVDRAVAERFTALPTEDSERIGSLCSYAMLASELGRPEAGVLLHGLLAPYRHRFVVDGIGAGFWGSVSLWAGLAAATGGLVTEARDLLQQSLAEHQRLGAPILAARSQSALERLAGGPNEVAAAVPRAGPTTLGHDSAQEAALIRDSDSWRVSFAGTTVGLRDSKGLRDLAVLLARPGCSVHVLELTAAGATPSTRATSTVREPGQAAGAEGDVGPVLDRRAAQEYRRRLAELDEETAAAGSHGDAELLARLRWEREALLEQLRSAFGVGGRPRPGGGPQERARKAVAGRINDTLCRIERVHPDLGRHLRASVRTGVFCCYDAEHPVRWSL